MRTIAAFLATLGLLLAAAPAWSADRMLLSSGFFRFCHIDHIDLCSNVKPNAPAAVPVAVLSLVNQEVNSAIHYKKDAQHLDIWAISPARDGDCDDYAVTKLWRLLKDYRVPREAMRLAFADCDGTVCARGEPHLVLLVDTMTGTFILDYATPGALPVSARPDLSLFAVEMALPNGMTTLAKWSGR